MLFRSRLEIRVEKQKRSYLLMIRTNSCYPRCHLTYRPAKPGPVTFKAPTSPCGVTAAGRRTYCRGFPGFSLELRSVLPAGSWYGVRTVPRSLERNARGTFLHQRCLLYCFVASKCTPEAGRCQGEKRTKSGGFTWYYFYKVVGCLLPRDRDGLGCWRKEDGGRIGSPAVQL